MATGLKGSVPPVAYAAIATGARLSFAIVQFSPITVADSRDKANTFRRSSILFRPHDPQTKDVGGAAGYRPRVRSAYYARVYVHSPEGQIRDSGWGRAFQGAAPRMAWPLRICLASEGGAASSTYSYHWIAFLLPLPLVEREKR